MRYGFIIDNRKCIGCHACTTACKSEHDVAVGVNRTWVKQVEKGIFPNTRRLFSVMRCNHCTEAPCVEICPVEALYFRPDGIVDFNKDRCIGCKSCMQACPYDALYIDPDNHTAAKCNYCAHRIDIGLEPACVNVCPEHAIISGDIDNPESEIFELLNREQTMVRKPEKGTVPNLFYINGDEASLSPIATEKSDAYLWSAQTHGVGHYAKYTEKLAYEGEDVLRTLMEKNGQSTDLSKGEAAPSKSIEILTGHKRRAYDAPDKGILWGWEVSAYVLTKAVAAGAFLLPFGAWVSGLASWSDQLVWWTVGIALVFLGLTGAFLVKDLDRPDRFLNVLLRPQKRSWLVRGGYGITVYGGLLTLLAAVQWLGLSSWMAPLLWITAPVAVFVAIYTAFLFAQAKGRDFWQSPALVLHMLVHSVMAGAALFLVLSAVLPGWESWIAVARPVLIGTLVLNLLTMWVEMSITHPTADAKATVAMIKHGRYKGMFRGVLLLGNALPLALAVFMGANAWLLAVAGMITLAGIYWTEKIWVEAPQRIQLS